MQVVDGHGLGCWLGHNDPKSKQHYTSQLRLTTTIQSGVHAANGPITDQGDVGACVGFTDLDIANTAKFYRSRLRAWGSNRYEDDEKGYGFYRAATRIDEWFDEQWEPDDTGSSVLAGAKALQQANLIESYTWAWWMDGFLAALQRQPVMLGTLWTDGMFDPDSTGLVRPTGDLSGGHAYMAFGWSYRSRKVKCRNHWTEDWGDDGDFYIGFDDMAWLIAQQGEVLIPKPV